MGDALEYLFGAAAFVPHGYCLLWRPDLVALHAVSDAVTAAAYFSIPAAILVFLRRRRDLDYPWLAALFATFILACGLTHVADLDDALVADLRPGRPAQGRDGDRLDRRPPSRSGDCCRKPAAAQPCPAARSKRGAGCGGRPPRGRPKRRWRRRATTLSAQSRNEPRSWPQANARLQAEIAERRRPSRRPGRARARLPACPESLRLAVEATDLGIWDVDVAIRHSPMVGRAESHPRAHAGRSAADPELFASLIHPDDRDWV